LSLTGCGFRNTMSRLPTFRKRWTAIGLHKSVTHTCGTSVRLRRRSSRKSKVGMSPWFCWQATWLTTRHVSMSWM